MTYWLDLFTGTTWKEFQDAGAHVSGFRSRHRKAVERVQPGDVLLCYMTGVMRWVGALKVTGPSKGTTKIWSDNDFPERLAVEPLIQLTAECGVPMDALLGKVSFFADETMRGKFKGFLRASLARFGDTDAKAVMDALGGARDNPVSREVDPKKLARRPLFKVEIQQGNKVVETVVSVPEPEEHPAPEDVQPTRHTEIQYSLLTLGAEMGLDVWVAKNDRTKVWAGVKLGQLPRTLDVLPTQFNAATTKTIELIDVLWLRSNSIVAAFEVECTTSIYSGLLRMSDLLALQPNLDIKLYLVAPEDRRDKVSQEILRPTFTRLMRPMPKVCGFLPFDKLQATADGIRKLQLAAALQPSFLEKVAEYFEGKAD